MTEPLTITLVLKNIISSLTNDNRILISILITLCCSYIISDFVLLGIIAVSILIVWTPLIRIYKSVKKQFNLQLKKYKLKARWSKLKFWQKVFICQMCKYGKPYGGRYGHYWLNELEQLGFVESTFYGSGSIWLNSTIIKLINDHEVEMDWDRMITYKHIDLHGWFNTQPLYAKIIGD